MGLLLSGFEGGLSITRGILGGGGGPNKRDFFGPCPVPSGANGDLNLFGLAH
jgi:hypothetical protein